MKASEILAAISKWADATSDEIVQSPAWGMPCRLGDATCVMRSGEVRAADTLDISILLEDEPHVLSFADSPVFKDLHRLWSVRSEVPEAILLALVEKECGPFLQLLENAARRQLRVAGLAGEAAESTLSLRICKDGEDVMAFAITPSPKLVDVFGKLAYIDTSDESVRGEALQAVYELASFTLPQDELASLTTGDALLLPEIGSIPPRLIVCGRFLVDESGVSAYADDGRLHVLGTEPAPLTLGDLFDHAASPTPIAVSNPRGLRLVSGGKAIADGRLDRIGEQNAFVVESIPHA